MTGTRTIFKESRVSRERGWRSVAVERRGRSRVSFWRRRRTIERKKARSGPEDKCLPTRRPARFYQGSRSSRFTERKRSEMEKKSGRMAERKRERERERETESDGGSSTTATTGRQDASARATFVCTDSSWYPSLCVSVGLVEVPAADRDQGESGSGLGSKMLHERVHVHRCNWSSSSAWFAGRPVRTLFRCICAHAARARSTHPS